MLFEQVQAVFMNYHVVTPAESLMGLKAILMFGSSLQIQKCHILATVLQELSRGQNLDIPCWLRDPTRVLELALTILSAKQPVEIISRLSCGWTIWIISWLLQESFRIESVRRDIKIMLVSSVLGDPASVLELALAILSTKQPVEEGGRRAARR